MNISQRNDENTPIGEWLDSINDPLTASFDAERTKKPTVRNVEMDHAPEGAKLDNALARAFLLAGNATFTVVSRKTGARFTFKLSRPKDEAPTQYPVRRKPIFIAVLSGPDNNSDYTYLGTVWEDAEKLTYAHGRKSRVSEDAPSVVAAKWVTKLLNNPALLDQCEIYHEGKCGRCGRKLTVPESIRTGLGPECAGRM